MGRLVLLLVLAVLVGSCEATAETIDPAIGLAMVELQPDGLGLVRLGAPVDETVAALVAVLGTPAVDDTDLGPFTAYLPYGFAADNYFRFVRWEQPDLWVAFSDRGRPGEAATFIGWGYWGSDGGPQLTTPDGIGVGSTVDELRNIFGDDLIISSSIEHGVRWKLTNGLGGELSDDPADPASRVSSVWGGIQPDI